MIVSNWVKRRMRFRQFFKAGFEVTGDVLTIRRDDHRLVDIELDEEERRRLIVALGGWVQGRFWEDDNSETRI